MKVLFYNCLSKKDLKKNNFQMTKEKYENLIKEVKEAKSNNKKINRHYWLLKHYDILTQAGKEHLIFPIKNEKILYYTPVEQIFEILFSTHESIDHGGRDRMRKELKQRYKNITLFEIQMFLNLCEPCIKKKKSEKKSLVVKPMISSYFNSRCQVDLIDYQSQADEDYKFVMVYQDHLTKFVVLRPLKSKKADEVANQLLDIFLLFGASTILQSDNGSEFCNNIIESLKITWPELKIIHGKPTHSQGSVEGAKQDIENMLYTWMVDNKTKNWSKALGFIQFMKNRALHAGIKKSPYEALFGQMAKIGLGSSDLPSEIFPLLNTEEELDMVLNVEKMEIEN